MPRYDSPCDPSTTPENLEHMIYEKKEVAESENGAEGPRAFREKPRPVRKMR
jgi:hypothetical protein